MNEQFELSIEEEDKEKSEKSQISSSTSERIPKKV